jgi:hypothetical protein
VPGAAVEADPFGDEIHRLLKGDPHLPGRAGEGADRAARLRWQQTIVDDYLREVRPLFLRPRTHQRTVYRPGEIRQWDLWQPSEPVPVGHGQTAAGVGGGGVLGLLARRGGSADLREGWLSQAFGGRAVVPYGDP